MTGVVDITVGGVTVAPGEQKRVDLTLARLYTHTDMTLPVEVLVGTDAGPRLWLSAALHGDELNGIEIIRQVLERIDVNALRGSITAVPIVNVFGFIYDSRYLPDRRDLNRSFPGSRSGSLASRLAWLFTQEIVAGADIGIDLHTAAPPRTNLPQVRGNLDDAETRRLSLAFGAPAIIHGGAPKGSLRAVAARRGKRVLLYEAGEPHRFNADAIDVGVRGVLNAMVALGMIDEAPPVAEATPFEARRTRWVRASQSGIFHPAVALGDRVHQGDLIGRVADPFGGMSRNLPARLGGMVVGMVSDPRVHRGDAVVHLAEAHGPAT